MGGTKSAPALPRLWRQIGLSGIAIGIMDVFVWVWMDV